MGGSVALPLSKPKVAESSNFGSVFLLACGGILRSKVNNHAKLDQEMASTAGT